MSAVQNTILMLVIALIVISIFYLESKKGPDNSNSADTTNSDVAAVQDKDKVATYDIAQEISSPDAFINTNNVTVQEHIGKNIVLVDFWTYSCINCQRTLPYLNDWHEKYGDKGLIILGLHTPEFEFEKDLSNVQRAVEKYGIEYPVILDNDYSTWRAYNNRYWPRKYLIDIDGYIVYDHIGEGAYEETEQKIVELLNERNERLGIEQTITADMETPTDADRVDFDKVKSRETYLGYERNEYLINTQMQSCKNETCQFHAPDNLNLPVGSYALDGSWNIGPESATLESQTGSIIIRFSASKVNLVAGGTQTSAEIYLDGKLITNEHAGNAVKNSTVTFDMHDLYNLVDLKGDYSEHTLEIRFKTKGINAFAFTFG